MEKKIIVCYLFTKYDDKISLINFIKNYNLKKAGAVHKLVVCFKLLEKKYIASLRLLLKNTPHIEFIDSSNINDYDFGSYMRVAQKYPSFAIFFLDSHSYPIANNWLRKVLLHYK